MFTPEFSNHADHSIQLFAQFFTQLGLHQAGTTLRPQDHDSFLDLSGGLHCHVLSDDIAAIPPGLVDLTRVIAIGKTYPYIGYWRTPAEPSTYQ